LGEAIAQASNIVRLDLRGNRITSKGFIELVYAALDSERLKMVNLRGNMIDQKGLLAAHRICAPCCEAGSAIEFSSEDGAAVAIMIVPLSNRKLKFDLRANMITEEQLEGLDTLSAQENDTNASQQLESKTMGQEFKTYLREAKIEALRTKQDRSDFSRKKPENSAGTKTTSSTEEILKQARRVLDDARAAPEIVNISNTVGGKARRAKSAKERKVVVKAQNDVETKLQKRDSKSLRKAKVSISSKNKLITRLRKSALGREVKPRLR